MLLAQLFIVMFWSELVLFSFFSFLIPSSLLPPPSSSLLGLKRHGNQKIRIYHPPKPDNHNLPPSRPYVLLSLFLLLFFVFENVLLGCF